MERTMTNEQAKNKIMEEFMTIYYAWLEDYKNLPDFDYAKKYGWTKFKDNKPMKDNLSTVVKFQKYIHCAFRTYEKWERFGIPSYCIQDLNRDGFLSCYRKHNVFYWHISQATAKQIYKEMKGRKWKC